MEAYDPGAVARPDVSKVSLGLCARSPVLQRCAARADCQLQEQGADVRKTAVMPSGEQLQRMIKAYTAVRSPNTVCTRADAVSQTVTESPRLVNIPGYPPFRKSVVREMRP